MDLLADILTVTQLVGDVFCHTRCEPPWGLSFDPGPEVRLHLVASGAALMIPRTGRTLALGPHDLVVLPHGAGHALCDDAASPRLPLEQLRARVRARGHDHPIVLATGARRRDRPPAEILCGTYRLAYQRTHPVLALLPAVIHIPGAVVAGHAGLQGTVQLMLREIAQRDVGNATVVSRLLEVLFVQVLRHWLDVQPAGTTGWLGALRDDSIGKALVLVHTAPERPWTVGSLAAAVGMSRAVFARRFAATVGDSPLEYLRTVRLERATRLLRDTDRPLAAIAAAVGYTSEFAFNRAFNRAHGTSPGRYRRDPG